MEGRNPPPPGHHPFPDHQAAVNKKFWGTPAARGFFRYIFFVGSVWVSLLSLNFYFTKDEPKFLGLDLDMTKEGFDRRQKILQSHPAKRSMALPVSAVPSRLFPDKNQPKGYNMNFDDSVRIFTAHSDEVARKIK